MATAKSTKTHSGLLQLWAVEMWSTNDGMEWRKEFTSAYHIWKVRTRYDGPRKMATFQCERCSACCTCPESDPPSPTRLVLDDPENKQDNHVLTCDERMVFILMES
jgi:hypothetical protein